MGLITLLSLLTLTAHSYPSCAPAAVPFTVLGRTGPVEILRVTFSQDLRERGLELTIRNRGGEPLRGAFLQIEFFDERRNLMSGFSALGFAGLRPLSLKIYEQLAPLESPRHRIGGEPWREPLASGAERGMDCDAFLVLPSCPASANVTVFAVMDDNYDWHRVSETVLRQTAVPENLQSGAERERKEVPALREALEQLGDVALHVRVETTGALALLGTQPRLSVSQVRLLEGFLKGRRFGASVEGSGPVPDELVILLRFGKEPFAAPPPDLPAALSRLPLLRVGVASDQLSIRRRY